MHVCYLLAAAFLGRVACSTRLDTAEVTGAILPVANPGFEQTSTEGDSLPAGWRKVPPTAQVTVDTSERWEGISSVLITRPAELPFAGVSQGFSAVPWRGKILLLRAKLNSAAIVSGNNGRGMRADGDGRTSLQFASTSAQSLHGDTNWVTRQLVMLVHDNANMLALARQWLRKASCESMQSSWWRLPQVPIRAWSLSPRPILTTQSARYAPKR